ncbi:MAG TPA: VWA domain-containing protein [Solirubrobacteraceae bacterium]|jgi:Ca-activated chloride channel family protein|nr:VWA domain-containing protein [Solirubrobacteraceae bacterium]
MSLASPLWLLALLLIPLALLAQRVSRHRARRYAIRFPGVPTLQAAVGTSSSWLRHLPAALLLAGVAALAIALARPHISYRVPVGDASVVLVLDHSGSMAATDVRPSRLVAANRAARAFASQLPSSVRLGAITFSSSPDSVQQPVPNHQAALSLLASAQANGGTNTGGALQLALQILHGSRRTHPPSAVVLLSDGAANLGPNPVTVADQAKQEHIPIYTVALGTPGGSLNTGPLSPPVAVPPDPQLMNEIASTSGARAFDARSADQLSSIYSSLGRRLGSVSRKRDITVDFAVAGLVLLLGAGIGSVRTSGVLP